MLLQDKVAVVTGGARGIGKEIISKFLENGAQPVIWDINQEAVSEAKDEFKDKVLIQPVDVTDYLEVNKYADKILDKFGKIDILVNNAGITKDALVMRMKEEEWDVVIKVNLKGTFICSKVISKMMMKQKSGKIVNIASIVGLMGNPGQANYSASKAGVIGLTKTIAKELASRNINVNAIAPGFIKTSMTEKIPQPVKEKMLNQIFMGKFGEPEDIANTVLFLSSNLSNYITGQVIVVDGGFYI